MAWVAIICCAEVGAAVKVSAPSPPTPDLLASLSLLNFGVDGEEDEDEEEEEEEEAESSLLFLFCCLSSSSASLSLRRWSRLQKGKHHIKYFPHCP